MSLFKARDWWTTKCGSEEEFDQYSLAVGNVDNAEDGKVKVVTGSLQGMLRIYAPRERDYRPEDLLHEAEMEQAVLGLEIGRFSQSVDGVSLAILHPRKLCVHQIVAHGSTHLEIRKIYEHWLTHSAANMCCGPFGGSSLDYICVQSYDGQVTVFEQESVAFGRYLPGFLVPGPICYVPDSDAFVTVNASFEAECYKYSSLAAAEDAAHNNASSDSAAADQGKSKKLQARWRVVLGEAAIDIKSARCTKNMAAQQTDIIIVGEHTIFVLREDGRIVMQKRLEYHPSCVMNYPVRAPGGPHGHENLIVGTHTGSCLVYEDTTLVWAAKTPYTPIAIRIAEFAGVQGLMVSLSDEGDLTISYMGTDSPAQLLGLTDGKELNYREMDKEHRRLLGVIREATSNTRREPTDRLILSAQVPQVLDSAGGPEPSILGAAPSTARKLTVRIYVKYSGKGTISEVRLTAVPPPPVTIEEDSFVLPHITGGARTPCIVPLEFVAGSSCLPANNRVTVVAAYLTSSGEPRTATCEIQLPMVLFAQVVPPVKNAGYKLTIDTNRNPPQLVTLFEDSVGQSPMYNDITGRASSANALTFQYYNGADVTVLVSKSAGRYRLQSDCFEAMWLVLEQLCSRLTEYFKSAEGPDAERHPEGPLTITYEDALPLQDYMAVVDKHFAARSAVRGVIEELDARAQQFRSIQKRLLVRFKDRNPVPVGHLDRLMDETYGQINQLANDLEDAEKTRGGAATSLGAATQLMLLLIRYRFGLPPEDFAVLKAHLSPEVRDDSVHGWEETTEAAMTSLLRSVLAKSAKERAVAIAPLAPAADTRRLQRHLSVVLERLQAGGSLVDASPTGAGSLQADSSEAMPAPVA